MITKDLRLTGVVQKYHFWFYVLIWILIRCSFKFCLNVNFVLHTLHWRFLIEVAFWLVLFILVVYSGILWTSLTCLVNDLSGRVLLQWGQFTFFLLIHCCFLFGIRGNPRLFMCVNIKPVGLHFCRIWVAQHVISLHQELFCLAHINVSSPQQRGSCSGMCLAVSLLPCRQTQGTF